jgi:glycosyltransferase involved in cell wall biosynthesis
MHRQIDRIPASPPRNSAYGVALRPAGDRPSRRQRRGLCALMIVECAGGGTGRHVLDLSQSLIERGCQVHLIYSAGRSDKIFLDRLADLQDLQRMCIPMRAAPNPGDAVALAEIRRYIRQQGPFDVIHGHSSKGGALARLAALGTGIPAFYTLHGLIMMDPGLPQWKWLFYLAIELGLSLGTARIIAVSPEESRAAVRLGFGRHRIITVPNGVQPARLTPRAEARERLGVGREAVVIGFVGRLVEQKAPYVLVRAFAETAGVLPQARLAVVGAGPLEQPLRELAGRLNVADKIIWLGELDARGVLAAFDLFALSSRKEGLPYVVLEAMAAGLPIVATSSAGVEILVEPGVNGAVVPRDDTAAFGRALIDLISDPVRLADSGEASLRRAGQFTVDLMADRTLAAYRSQLPGEGQP